MKLFNVSGLNLAAVLGMATAAWAFCPPDADQTKSAEAAKSGQPCPHSHGDGTTVVKVSDDVSKTEEKSGGCAKKDCCKKKGAASVASEKSGGCAKASSTGSMTDAGKGPVESVLASLPAMKYRVGDEIINCPKSAEALSMKSNTPIKYVVGDQTFEKKSEATVALTQLLESEVDHLLAVQFSASGKTTGCPHEASEIAKQNNTKVTYRVGGMEYFEKSTAEKAAKLASDAASAVKLSYKVGDERFCCDKMAGMKCKESGKSMTYMVGTEETCCAETAKLLVAQAKIRAIVEAAASVANS